MASSLRHHSGLSIVDLSHILHEASEYCHSVIKSSATSLNYASATENSLTQMDVDNMRELISSDAKTLSPTYADKISDEKMCSSPRLFQISEKHIEESKVGNCGEFVVLGLAYLLKIHKEKFKDFVFLTVAAGANESNMNHLYVHIKHKFSDEILFWDPTTQEVARVAEKSGNIFIRARHSKPNSYIPFDPSKDHVSKIVASIDPVKFVSTTPPPPPRRKKCIII